MAAKTMWSYFMAFNAKNRKGFTIVELMIAISVFSVVMIIATTGILLVARQYQSGVTKTAMQSATRDIHQKISDSIKYSGGSVWQKDSSSPTGYSVICAGNIRYFYKKPDLNIDNKIENFSSLSSLYYEQKTTGSFTDSDCGIGPSTDSQQLLPNNAKVAVFDVTTAVEDGVTKSATISTRFVKGDEDLFNLPEIPAQLQCKSGVGNEWCSVVSLSSIVNPRL